MLSYLTTVITIVEKIIYVISQLDNIYIYWNILKELFEF